MVGTMQVWQIWPAPIPADSERECAADNLRTEAEVNLFLKEVIGTAPIIALMREGCSRPLRLWNSRGEDMVKGK